jgi:hypothetical protein
MKTNRGARGSFVFALIALAAASAASPLAAASLTDAMASFDRAYIPVLALTSQGKAEAAAGAMTILKAEWPDWVRENSAAYPDAGWALAIERVGRIISTAEGLIAKADLAGAHEALEEVRAIFMAQRDARAIPYYVDGLNHYHTAMEGLLAVTAGKSAGGLTADDLAKLASLLPEARALWTRAQEARFDAAIYGFSAARTQELQRTMEATLASIDAVDRAVKGADAEAVLKAVEGLKPAFTKAFLMFGDFEGLSKR